MDIYVEPFAMSFFFRYRGTVEVGTERRILAGWKN